MKSISLFASLTLVGALLLGCNSTTSSSSGSTGSSGSSSVSGAVSVDGSSTVTPIMEAVAEEFQASNPDTNPTIGTSGTGGGFKKFLKGETDISMASRPIKESESEEAKANGIEYIEIPVALDGLTVVINKENDFAETLTVEELAKIWGPDSKLKNWSEVRDGFPNEEIKLYGPGTDSGTFDYFTLAINGDEGASRSDYQANEDDNVLVKGVADDKFALGYFGFAYYVENQDTLKSVIIDNGTAAVAPSLETIGNGSYYPLSRPLFIYVNKAKLEDNEALAAMLDFFFEHSDELIAETGYIPLPAEIKALAKEIVSEKQTGTRFQGAEVGLGVDEILKAEGK